MKNTSQLGAFASLGSAVVSGSVLNPLAAVRWVLLQSDTEDKMKQQLREQGMMLPSAGDR